MFKLFKKSQNDVIDYGGHATQIEQAIGYRGAPEPITPSGEFPAVILDDAFEKSAGEFPAVILD